MFTIFFNMNENLGNKEGLNIVDEKWKFFFENKTLCNHYRSSISQLIKNYKRLVVQKLLSLG